MRSFLLPLILNLLLPASACIYKRDTPEYSYEGKTGPLLWHTLSSEYATCATGKEQSPIDVTSSLPTAPGTHLLYPPSAEFVVENNGHAIELTPDDDEELVAMLGGRRHKLLQFHYHTPSEHRLDDEFFPAEVHLVHEDVENKKVSVVGIFLELIEAGNGDATLCAIYPYLDQVTEKTKDSDPHVEATVPLHSFTNLIDNSRIRTYAGSLTTPPCDESVTWYVAESPLAITVAQFNKMKKIIKFNSRVTQNAERGSDAKNLLELARDGFPKYR